VTTVIANVFVYGTLMPGQPRWQLLQPFTDAAAPKAAAVPGHLYDTTRGWPAAVLDQGCPDRVPGVLVPIATDTADALLRLLDDVEGVDVGLFTRVAVITECGTRAWAYTWPSPTSGLARLDAWTG
jgi:gamma-glutamylcyclotransferase (GGCT)/AIG2-like uncharacterized protein YtfP